MVIIKIR